MIVERDLIYDVGLHRGQDTAFYLAKGFRVVAFEANPSLVAYCRERFAAEISSGQLQLVPGAVVDQATSERAGGRIRFFVNRDMDIWGTVDPAWAERNDRLGAPSSEIEVACVDFAAVLRERGVPHYLKIDIEGCDIACLEALRATGARPSYVSLESSKTSMEAIRAEIGLLEALGYDAFQAIEQSGIPKGQAVPRPAREGRDIEHAFERGCSGLFGDELPGRWKSATQILGDYRWINRGYRLLGDAGRLHGRGLGALRWIARRLLQARTGARVPGWYDTHARHGGLK
jgi:FkbM family methyltransferase